MNISKICFAVSSKNKCQFCGLCLVVLSKAIVFLLGSIYGLPKRRDNIRKTYYFSLFPRISVCALINTLPQISTRPKYQTSLPLVQTSPFPPPFHSLIVGIQVKPASFATLLITVCILYKWDQVTLDYQQENLIRVPLD